MDIPEMNIVRRTLREQRADAAEALAVLLKTLGDDHLLTYGPLDDDDEPIEPTLLESLFLLVRAQQKKNGERAVFRDATGEYHERPGAVADVAGDMMMGQDTLRELFGGYLDHLSVFEPHAEAEAA